MNVVHGLLHSTALVHSDSRRDAGTLWPRDTTITDHDVIVGGRSLTALARKRRTPCVLITPDGVADSDSHRTLVVANVTARDERRGWHHGTEITVDCALKEVALRVMHAELLNTPREQDLVLMTIRAIDGAALRARLPRMTSPGDLLLLVCNGTLALNQVTPRTRPSLPAATDSEETHAGCRKYLGGQLDD